MVDVKGLRFSYRRLHPVLQDYTFHINAGERLAVLGNNGAGKSTLLKCLVRIILPQRGIICTENDDILKMSRLNLARKIALVAQNECAVRMTVYDMVMLGRKPYIKWGITARDKKIVEAVLCKLRLDNMAARFTDELSGGEHQKVMLARAFAQQPKILLLDEPTASLDLRNQYEVLDLVKEISAEQNIAVIMVIHDINLALRFCNKFMLIKDARIYACGGEEIITNDTVETVYGIAVDVIDLNGVRVMLPKGNA
ncbi:MAG: ABC transporter ATP-binding protein [Treponema sp.]|jgi:iron complex transport system ATP-binding protein|nr:ABC transporter ATP-binding protein [Treponema sp.]